MDISNPQENAQRKDAAPVKLSGEDPSKRNGGSLYEGSNDFWSDVALPDWSNEHTAQCSAKPKDWCSGSQCEHPRSKNGYTFYVRSRLANAYLRSLQLAGDVPTIDPMNVEALAEVSRYRVSKDAHKMGLELLKHLRGSAFSDDSGGGCCSPMLVGAFLRRPGYASFQTPSIAQEFLSSAEGADPVEKWNEFFELIHKQHRDSFPTYYTLHTGDIPRYFYQRFQLLADLVRPKVCSTLLESRRQLHLAISQPFSLLRFDLMQSHCTR